MKLHTLILIGLAVLSQSPRTLDRKPADQQPQRPINRSEVTTSSIAGTVTDKAGAVVAGAQVTLESSTFGQRTTVTSAEGFYRFERVPLGGEYRLRFVHVGFQTIVKNNVTVSVGSSRTLDVQFDIGASPTPRPSPVPSPRPSVSPTPIATPTNSSTPSPTPVVVSYDWDTLVRREVEKLRDSKIVFNPPLQMQQGKRERVEARISFEEIGAALTEGLKGRGAAQVDSIKVGPIMKVVLTGDEGAFTIEKFSTDEQTVAGKPYAQWEWDVTPLASGNRSLHLQATATIYVPERGEKPFDIPVIHKNISVRVDPWFASKRFVADNWQWLWTTLVIPAAGVLWGLRRRKKRRAGFR